MGACLVGMLKAGEISRFPSQPVAKATQICFLGFYICFGTSRVTMRFYALHRKLPRIISEIFNTSLVDQKAKGVGLPMLRSNHEICVFGFRAKRQQNPAPFFSETGNRHGLGTPQYAA
jgi:hypothetical protein